MEADRPTDRGPSPKLSSRAMDADEWEGLSALLSEPAVEEPTQVGTCSGEVKDDLDSLLHACGDGDLSEAAVEEPTQFGTGSSDVTDDLDSLLRACGDGDQGDESFSFQARGPQPGKKRGRPPGSKLLREAHKNIEHELPSGAERFTAAPGSVEYARAAKAAKAAERRTQGIQTTAMVPYTGPPLLASGSGLWPHLRERGAQTHVQRCLIGAAWYSFSNQTELERENELITELCAPQRSYKSKQVRTNEGNTSRKTVSRAVIRSTAAILEGCAVLFGGMLGALRSAIESNAVVPVMFVSKLLFDETPTKLRIRGQDVVPFSLSQGRGPGNEDKSDHAKVVQTSHEIHAVFHDGNGRTLHIEGTHPVALQVVDRTTAECTKKCLMNAFHELPGIREFASAFPLRMLLGTFDRYAANPRAMKAFLYDLMGDTVPFQSWCSVNFTCDVHKANQVRVSSTKIFESEISSMLASALSQGGPGLSIQIEETVA